MKVMLLLLLLAVASSKAQLVTYLFPEDKDITICPPITSSTTLPSFKLEPVSATGHDQFLIGTYEVSDTSIIPGVDIARENVSCTNNSARTCTQLTVRYGGDPRLGRDFFIVTYTAANRVTRKIRVNFGYVGVYLLNETPGLVVGRQPNLTIAANNSLVIFGTINRRVTCLENGTEAPSNLLIFAPESFSNDVCFGNNQQQTNSQPGLLTVFLANRTGQERIYFVDSTSSDCSSDRISDTFLFIFDPPPVEVPDAPSGPTTTQPPGSTTTQPINPGLPLGTMIGLAVVAASLLVVGVILAVIFIIWCRRRPREVAIHNEVPDGRVSHSPELHGDQHERVPLVPVNNVPPQLTPPPPPNRELYIVLSSDHERVKLLREKLYGCFNNFHSASLPNENGNFEQDLTRIINRQHVAIILGDVGEIHVNQSSSGRKWVRTLLDSAAFKKEQLRHVFYVLFGTTAVITGYMEKLQQIPVPEQPDDADFDPAYVAKLIHEKITEIMSSHSQNQLNQQNHLEGNSSHSITSQTNRLSTSDLGSELSESSWKGASNENRTENEETHDIDGQVTDTNNTQVILVNPTVARLRASSHGSSTSGGLESSSTSSVRTVGSDAGEAIEGGNRNLTTDKDNPMSNIDSTTDLQSSSTTSMVEALMGAVGKRFDKLEEKVVGAVVEGFEKVGGAVQMVGNDVKNVEGAVEMLGKNLEEDRAEMKDRVEGMEQDIEHAMGVAELARNDVDNLVYGTIPPYSDDDKDNEGQDSAATREDAA